MAQDPFEQFERSRGGLLIPVILFVMGAVPTALAIRAIDGLEVREPSKDDKNPAPENQDAEEPAEFVRLFPDQEAART